MFFFADCKGALKQLRSFIVLALDRDGQLIEAKSEIMLRCNRSRMRVIWRWHSLRQLHGLEGSSCAVVWQSFIESGKQPPNRSWAVQLFWNRLHLPL